MRFCLLFLASAALAAEDELFTGVPAEKVPAEVQQFTNNLKRAFESGNVIQVLNFAAKKDMTGSAWVLFRARLPEFSREKPPKVKRIELTAGASEEDREFKRAGVQWKAPFPPTHNLTVVLEMAEGETKQLELPAAKVSENEDNREMWRLIPLVPKLADGTTVRIEEAKAEAVQREGAAYYEAEVLYLHALLGHREEVEKGAAAVLEKAGQQKPYIHGRLGWCYLNLDEPKKALEHFKQQADADAGAGWFANYLLAVGNYINGNKDAAVKHWEKAGNYPTLSDRKSLEDWTKTMVDKEREAVFGVFNLWQRTAAPK